MSGTTAPSSRISLRAEVSRDRFCSAPAAEPQTAAEGVRSSMMSGAMPSSRRMRRMASGSEEMLCTAPTARVCTLSEGDDSSGSTAGMAPISRT